jgi:hypothetical protein
MATIVKKNEEIKLNTFKNGVTLQFFTITFPATVAGKLDADTVNYSGAATRSPVAVALDAITQVASVECIGAGNGSTTVNIAIAALGGTFGTDTWDGTNSETFAAHLEDLVQATSTATSGWVTYQGQNLDSATVTAFTF